MKFFIESVATRSGVVAGRVGRPERVAVQRASSRWRRRPRWRPRVPARRDAGGTPSRRPCRSSCASSHSRIVPSPPRDVGPQGPCGGVAAARHVARRAAVPDRVPHDARGTIGGDDDGGDQPAGSGRVSSRRVGCGLRALAVGGRARLDASPVCRPAVDARRHDPAGPRGVARRATRAVAGASRSRRACPDER